MSYLRILPSLLMPICFVAIAQEPSTRTSVQTYSKLQPEMTSPASSTVLAQQWGLKEEELFRFKELMSGPLGTYSPNLDPLSALGIEARTDAERLRYAQLQVEAEATRVEKLLVYQRAYDTAWKERYPGLALMNSPPINSPMLSKSSIRPAVFVQYNCLQCEITVKQLLASGATFDIYVVNSEQDDRRIRQWALKVGIQSSQVRDGTITISHDNGRWLSISANGELPAVMHKVNGKWLRQ
ncbi:TIGR03759 family integrating conjugative element protein [Pseudomonas sp. lyk4-TYG-107]|uniref:TIGR03759 family integrating conjugative element protein n=1 Tax=Pseudomonas sp. lyk4-TYG-107 TaxID=3040317 RepID=UPI002554A5EC|nr:TIGR03759 family integrating conjugative element protein [Pseudomonas sp. lyk4-TYG-107]